MKTKVTNEDLDKHDSMLAHALKLNATNPIKYNGMWFPKGTLKKLLDAYNQEKV